MMITYMYMKSLRPMQVINDTPPFPPLKTTN